jgi:membrane protein DedA with SNARE-associated domain
MPFLTDDLLDLVGRNNNELGLLLIGMAACVEYVFPPFPGDLVVLFGAFLVARRGWSATRVLGAVLLGSAIGCMSDYYLGRWLARVEQHWVGGRLARARPRIDLIVARFRRHGTLYIVINRFLPSLRALFFVAAGMAQLPAGKVLACGLVSALLWNGVLLVVGATVAREWRALLRIFETYGLVAWALVLLVALGLALRWARRRAHASGR